MTSDPYVSFIRGDLGDIGDMIGIRRLPGLLSLLEKVWEVVCCETVEDLHLVGVGGACEDVGLVGYGGFAEVEDNVVILENGVFS